MLNEKVKKLIGDIMDYSDNVFPFCDFYPCAFLMSKWTEDILNGNTIRASSIGDKKFSNLGYIFDVENNILYLLGANSTFIDNNLLNNFLDGDTDAIDDHLSPFVLIVGASSFDKDTYNIIKSYNRKVVLFLANICRANQDESRFVLPLGLVDKDDDSIEFTEVISNIHTMAVAAKNIIKAAMKGEDPDMGIERYNDEMVEYYSNHDICKVTHSINTDMTTDPILTVLALDKIINNDIDKEIPPMLYDAVTKVFEDSVILKIIDAEDSTIYVAFNKDGEVKLEVCKSDVVVMTERSKIPEKDGCKHFVLLKSDKYFSIGYMFMDGKNDNLISSVKELKEDILKSIRKGDD